MKQVLSIYAARPDRFFAYLIDVLLVLIPVSLLAELFVHEDQAGKVVIEPMAYVVTFLVNLSYHTYFVGSRWQATPGMRMLSMYIARTNHRPLRLRDAAERFLAFIMPTLPIYASFIAEDQARGLVAWLTVLWFAPILFTPERVGLHDRLCGTRVLTGKVGI